MHGKSDPLGSEPAEVVLGSNAKMLPTVAALIIVNLDVDAELEEVPTMTLLPLSILLVSTRHSFVVGKTK